MLLNVINNCVWFFSAIPLLGYLPQDLNGMSIFDFYHKDDLETLCNIYKRSKDHSKSDLLWRIWNHVPPLFIFMLLTILSPIYYGEMCLFSCYKVRNVQQGSY